MKRYIKPAIIEVYVDSERLMNPASQTPTTTFGTGTATTMEADDLDLDWDEE